MIPLFVPPENFKRGPSLDKEVVLDGGQADAWLPTQAVLEEVVLPSQMNLWLN